MIMAEGKEIYFPSDNGYVYGYAGVSMTYLPSNSNEI
jgi:hypothetical protein